MYCDEEIFQKVHGMIKPEYLTNSKMYLTVNQSGYNSINVISNKTPYRDAPTSALLFARIGVNGIKKNNAEDIPPYISVHQKYHKLFDEHKIKYTYDNSQNKYIFISLEIFDSKNENYQIFSEILNKIFLDIFSFPPFGCCSKFIECSDAKRCLHEDMAYSTVCQYRANLENGKIFYGKNKNI